MNVWGWLAILLIISSSLGYLFRVFYKKGYSKGKEDADEAWSKKTGLIYERLNDASDDGTRVSDGSLWKGTTTKPRAGVE